jgi:hypothetical protein
MVFIGRGGIADSSFQRLLFTFQLDDSIARCTPSVVSQCNSNQTGGVLLRPYILSSCIDDDEQN